MDERQSTVAPLVKGRWARRKVFVTGASGLMGSALLRRLQSEGADVVVLLRDQVPAARAKREGAFERAVVVHGDVRDGHVLRRTLAEYEIEVVFHLAAQTAVTVAAEDPLSTFETNVGGTWHLLEACRGHKSVQAIVVASSDKAYGPSEKLPYDEGLALRGRSPYDVSKSCADLITQAYWSTYRLPVAITRCGNLYGPGDLNFNRIIPGTIRSLYHREAPVLRSSGRYLRDYLYVEDACDAYVALAERAMADETVLGRAFNFSGGEPKTVFEMVRSIAQTMNKTDIEPVVLDQADLEIPDQVLD